MSDLPSGTVTFLFTDIEDSTPLWERQPEAMKTALSRHDTLLRSSIEAHNGQVVKTTGDGFHAVFARAEDGIDCTLAAQRALAAESWEPAIGRLLVRMALHTGAAERRGGDYYGAAVNRAARLEAAAHGGQILLSETTRGLVADSLPQDVSLADLGPHRLKGFSHPERVYQLVAPDLPLESRSLRTATRWRYNLPLQSTPFIGRRRELAEIRRLLGETRLLTLVGPGGMGKTRLALQAASERIGDYAHGVYFVSLAPISSADLVVQAIAEAIGFPLATGEDPKQQLLRHLRSREFLLLIDNFEHLLGAAGIIGELLDSAAALTLLVTSRERLKLQGESLLPIEGLDYPNSGEKHSPAIQAALDSGAVRLFVESAERVDPAFAVRADTLPHIIQICRLVQGMPLALLLSAAWMDLLSPAEMAVEIGRSLDVLESDWRDVPGRHRSIRAAFEPSWKRLDGEQRDLFARLSIFRGGFTREAAEEVAGASLRTLAALAGKSLLRRDPQSGRYEIHELLRQYAQEHLESTPHLAKATAEAHAVTFATFMERRRAALLDARQHVTLIEMEADLENVRSAWRFWLERRDAARLEKFLDSFWRLHDVHGWYNAAVELYQDAVRVLRPATGEAPAEENEAVYAQALGHQAYFMIQQGNSRDAYVLLEESVTILRRLERWRELALPLQNLSWSATYVKDRETATAFEQEGEAAAIKGGGLWLRAFALCWKGRRTAIFQSLREGKRYIKESLRLFQELGDYYATVWPGLELGNAAVYQGAYSEAREHYERVLREAREFSYEWAVGKANRYLGDVAILQGEFEEARAYLLRSLKHSDEVGLVRDVVNLLYDLATVEAASGSPERAVAWFTAIGRHPFSDQTRSFSLWERDSITHIRALAERALAQLRASLPAELYESAAVRGRSLELEAILLEAQR